MVLKDRISKGFNKTVFAKENNSYKEVILSEILKKYDADSIIRIHCEEFKNIDKNKEFFTHFNIQNTKHEVGKKYLLISIVSRTKENEPVLDFQNSIKCECEFVDNFVEFKDLNLELFENSMITIKNVEQLKEAIIKRYKTIYSDKTDNELLDLGVGITTLKFIK